MKLVFDNVMPHPLRDDVHGSKSIWGEKIEFQPGQHILLNATSGKGKSTFVHLAFGLRNDYEGNIYIEGHNIRDFSVDDWVIVRREKMALVFQDMQLFSQLSVKQNLLLKNEICQHFSESKIKEMVAFLELADKWETKCNLLSMGQQQRIAIVRSLIQPFEWLLMDEPFSHLDEKNTLIALDLIEETCRKNNAGFILTTLGDTYAYPYDKELFL
jgi:ABC-type lipoprotein export system ATPase subunit